MNDSEREADRWLRQAENDLAFAKMGVQDGFYSQTCFLCQQAGEKAVKALHYWFGERVVIGHSIQKLSKDLVSKVPEVKSYIEKGGRLDQFYIPARYPNGIPEGAPCDMFSESQAREAVGYAKDLIDFCTRIIRS